MNLIETEWPERIAPRQVAAVFKQILCLFITGVKHVSPELLPPTALDTTKIHVFLRPSKAFDASSLVHLVINSTSSLATDINL